MLKALTVVWARWLFPFLPELWIHQRFLSGLVARTARNNCLEHLWVISSSLLVQRGITKPQSSHQFFITLQLSSQLSSEPSLVHHFYARSLPFWHFLLSPFLFTYKFSPHSKFGQGDFPRGLDRLFVGALVASWESGTTWTCLF